MMAQGTLRLSPIRWMEVEGDSVRLTGEGDRKDVVVLAKLHRISGACFLRALEENSGGAPVVLKSPVPGWRFSGYWECAGEPLSLFT
jgi:hypothetical protein